jgi:hypothetical protein
VHWNGIGCWQRSLDKKYCGEESTLNNSRERFYFEWKFKNQWKISEAKWEFRIAAKVYKQHSERAKKTSR